MDDEGLMKQVAKGDQAAFELLVDRYYKSAYRYLIRLTGHTRDAEDLLQEGFMAIWLKADTFKSDAKFQPWFYSIFYHLYIDSVRKHKRESPLAFEPIDPYKMDSDLTSHEVEHRIQNFVTKLPLIERQAFVLYYYQQQKVKDISLILNSSVPAVESILYRVRKKLKTCLKGH